MRDEYVAIETVVHTKINCYIIKMIIFVYDVLCWISEVLPFLSWLLGTFCYSSFIPTNHPGVTPNSSPTNSSPTCGIVGTPCCDAPSIQSLVLLSGKCGGLCVHNWNVSSLWIAVQSVRTNQSLSKDDVTAPTYCMADRGDSVSDEAAEWIPDDKAEIYNLIYNSNYMILRETGETCTVPSYSYFQRYGACNVVHTWNSVTKNTVTINYHRMINTTHFDCGFSCMDKYHWALPLNNIGIQRSDIYEDEDDTAFLCHHNEQHVPNKVVQVSDITPETSAALGFRDPVILPFLNTSCLPDYEDFDGNGHNYKLYRQDIVTLSPFASPSL